MLCYAKSTRRRLLLIRPDNINVDEARVWCGAINKDAERPLSARVCRILPDRQNLVRLPRGSRHDGIGPERDVVVCHLDAKGVGNSAARNVEVKGDLVGGQGDCVEGLANGDVAKAGRRDANHVGLGTGRANAQHELLEMLDTAPTCSPRRDVALEIVVGEGSGLGCCDGILGGRSRVGGRLDRDRLSSNCQSEVTRGPIAGAGTWERTVNSTTAVELDVCSTVTVEAGAVVAAGSRWLQMLLMRADLVLHAERMLDDGSTKVWARLVRTALTVAVVVVMVASVVVTVVVVVSLLVLVVVTISSRTTVMVVVAASRGCSDRNEEQKASPRLAGVSETMALKQFLEHFLGLVPRATANRPAAATTESFMIGSVWCGETSDAGSSGPGPQRVTRRLNGGRWRVVSDESERESAPTRRPGPSLLLSAASQTSASWPKYELRSFFVGSRSNIWP